MQIIGFAQFVKVNVHYLSDFNFQIFRGKCWNIFPHLIKLVYLYIYQYTTSIFYHTILPVYFFLDMLFFFEKKNGHFTVSPFSRPSLFQLTSSLSFSSFLVTALFFLNQLRFLLFFLWCGSTGFFFFFF